MKLEKRIKNISHLITDESRMNTCAICNEAMLDTETLEIGIAYDMLSLIHSACYKPDNTNDMEIEFV